jgi:hypothetical protein
MDEIEYLRAYNTTVSSVSEIIDLDVKATMMQILQLINGLHEQIMDLQTEEDDDDEDDPSE